MKYRSELSVLAVSASTGALIGMSYAFVLPAFWPGYGTAWILTVGVLISILACAYIGFHVPTATTPPVRIILGICYGAVAGIITTFVSLFIAVNVRGS